MSTQLSSQAKASPLARHLRAGKVYRREDLVPYSTSVDRELQQLVAAGRLAKAAQGLYYAPRKSVFGDAPPAENEMLAAFLKDKNFLSFNPSVYNSLRLGMTQLYNKTIVYNHKRHGKFRLGNREFDFRVKHRFPLPNQVSSEYLLVDMLNNFDELAEDEDHVFAIARRKLPQFDAKKLQNALQEYGSAATRRLLKKWLKELDVAQAGTVK
ncbi:MAG: hypothetical protein Q8O37_06240 [Sulfuricellaceae bacterium]|nr:hypothetical protein [Sulfuricellaceae bacterium]